MKWITRERPKIDRMVAIGIAIATILVLSRFKKIPEPYIILITAALGFAIKSYL